MTPEEIRAEVEKFRPENNKLARLIGEAILYQQDEWRKEWSILNLLPWWQRWLAKLGIIKVPLYKASKLAKALSVLIFTMAAVTPYGVYKYSTKNHSVKEISYKNIPKMKKEKSEKQVEMVKKDNNIRKNRLWRKIVDQKTEKSDGYSKFWIVKCLPYAVEFPARDQELWWGSFIDVQKFFIETALPGEPVTSAGSSIGGGIMFIYNGKQITCINCYAWVPVVGRINTKYGVLRVEGKYEIKGKVSGNFDWGPGFGAKPNGKDAYYGPKAQYWGNLVSPGDMLRVTLELMESTNHGFEVLDSEECFLKIPFLKDEEKALKRFVQECVGSPCFGLIPRDEWM